MTTEHALTIADAMETAAKTAAGGPSDAEQTWAWILMNGATQIRANPEDPTLQSIAAKFEATVMSS